MYFGNIFMFDFLDFPHEVHVLVEPFIVLNEVFLIIHDIFIGRFLGAIDVDWSKVRISDGFDQG